MKPHVSFVGFDKDILDKLSNMNGIINKDDIVGLCTENPNKLCIPTQHLISGIDNEQLYYNRLTDELIRYNRIRLFILESTKYLNIEI